MSDTENKGTNYLYSLSNDILEENRDSANKQYHDTAYNFFKYLNSATKIVGTLLNMLIDTGVSKATLAKMGVDIFAFTPPPEPTPNNVDDNYDATQGMSDKIAKAMYEQAKNGASNNSSGDSYGIGGTTSVSISGNSNAEIIWNFLKSEGFTDEGAAGVIGNLMQESHCDPTISEGGAKHGELVIDGNTGYGIAQWTFITRQEDLQKKANQMGKPTSSLEVQLAFLKDESMAYGAWDVCKTATNIESATKDWHDIYEGSNDYNAFGGIQGRYDYAHEAYNNFAKKHLL